MCMVTDFTKSRSVPLLLGAALGSLKLNPELRITLEHLVLIVLCSMEGDTFAQSVNVDKDALMALLRERLGQDCSLCGIGGEASAPLSYQDLQRQMFCKRFSDAVVRCSQQNSGADQAAALDSFAYQGLLGDPSFSAILQLPAAQSKLAMCVDMPMEDAKSASNKRKLAAQSLPTNNSNNNGNKTVAPMLQTLGADLVVGALDRTPVCGRDTEVSRAQATLSRGQSVVLIGPKGVGRKTVVEGLAQKIAAENVPEALIGSDVVQIQAADVIKAAQDTAAASVFANALHATQQQKPNTVVFIPDVDEVLECLPPHGARTQASAAVSQALQRSGLRFVATATPEKHRLVMASRCKNPFAQRFQQVHVREMATHTAARVLTSWVKSSIEAKHGVTVESSAVTAAVTLAHSHVKGAVLPQAAIDLLSRACKSVVKQQKQNALDANVGAEHTADEGEMMLSCPPSPPSLAKSSAALAAHLTTPSQAKKPMVLPEGPAKRRAVVRATPNPATTTNDVFSLACSMAVAAVQEPVHCGSCVVNAAHVLQILNVTQPVQEVVMIMDL